jgi:hypothetical protein
MSPTSTTSNLSLPPEPEAEKEKDQFVTSSFNNSCEYLERKTINQYLVRDIQPPNHESCFPQFFSTKFSQLKKKTNFLFVQNRFFLVLDQRKGFFLFHLVKLRKIRRKIGENKIRGLVV